MRLCNWFSNEISIRDCYMKISKKYRIKLYCLSSFSLILLLFKKFSNLIFLKSSNKKVLSCICYYLLYLYYISKLSILLYIKEIDIDWIFIKWDRLNAPLNTSG